MAKIITTPEELLKLARNQVFTGQVNAYDEVMVRCLFDELKYRQKRNVKKKSTNHYQDWLYYIAYDGRLARVPNTAKNPLGRKLLKSKTIKIDEWGLPKCDEVLSAGQFVRIRPLLTELDPKERWDSDVKEKISKFLEGGKQCKLIIDRNFEVAYEPDYDDDFCLDGDLVTGQSCMSEQGSAAQEFYGGIDGCYVCRFENEDGEQVGRCIMYEYNGVRHFIRIYAYRDYARCALRLLRAEMKENDLFGRSVAIPNMCLSTNWDWSTPTMYLDGRYYGVNINEHTVVNTNDRQYDLNFKTTGNEEIEEYYHDCGYQCCAYCGEWCNEDNGIYCNDEFYCCDDCAESDGCRRCEHCGEWESGRGEGYEIDGCWYCSESCAEADGWTRCEECGDWLGDNEDYIEINGCRFCNEDCVKNYGYVKCANCGEYILEYQNNKDEDDRWLCKDCARELGLELQYVKKKEQEQNETEVKND